MVQFFSYCDANMWCRAVTTILTSGFILLLLVLYVLAMAYPDRFEEDVKND